MYRGIIALRRTYSSVSFLLLFLDTCPWSRDQELAGWVGGLVSTEYLICVSHREDQLTRGGWETELVY